MTPNSSVLSRLRMCMDQGLYADVVLNSDHSGESYSGFITGIGDGYVAVQEVYDMRLEGTRVFSIVAVVDCVFEGDTKRGQQEILEWSGISQSSCVDWISLDDPKSCIESIANNHNWLAVHDGPGCDIGQIVSVGLKTFELLAVRPIGEWYEESFEISYDDVSHLNIGDHYSETYRRYMSRDC
ncbi:hypothetical protein [Kordiimonas lacus]|uniref:Uncharacterized protein n=1 Tax=Kordiimonas lacus TaxID=637679 RepID=A0A1G6WUH4_9PROT|nr:hypothetical protein [Kordiimonas lacus]SDD68675.1 hypothetical protein SAMN04488071_1204 [Kordiimonas lacus]